MVHLEIDLYHRHWLAKDFDFRIFQTYHLTDKRFVTGLIEEIYTECIVFIDIQGRMEIPIEWERINRVGSDIIAIVHISTKVWSNVIYEPKKRGS